MGEIYKPSKNGKIRILPHPDSFKPSFKRYLFNIDTEGLNLGDYVKIKDVYAHKYDTNVTYKIECFQMVVANQISVKLDKNIIGTNTNSINVSHFEIDANYYRKQKIKSLLNDTSK